MVLPPVVEGRRLWARRMALHMADLLTGDLQGPDVLARHRTPIPSRRAVVASLHRDPRAGHTHTRICRVLTLAARRWDVEATRQTLCAGRQASRCP